MPASPCPTAGLSVSSSFVASPLLNPTAVTLVEASVPPTVKTLAGGAAVVSRASSNVSVSVDPSTDAPLTSGSGWSGVSFLTRPVKPATSLPAASRNASLDGFS